MPRGGSARRYAEAVFQIALERNELGQWLTYLKKIAEAAGNSSLKALLESPKLTFHQKRDLMQQTLKDISPLALNLVGLLVARGRLSLAPDVVEVYGRLLNAHHGISDAEVISAVPLEQVEQEQLSQRLSEILGKKVVLHCRTDANIVGGLVVKTEEWILDGSTRSKLEGLKKSLIETGR